MNIVFIGHVDAGKSTTGGQILYLTVSCPICPRCYVPCQPDSVTASQLADSGLHRQGGVDERTIQKYEK